MSTAAASGAAAAAAAQQLMRQEEEAMTPYTNEDLVGDWEFKILRSTARVFRDPARLQEVLDEERRAGWVLLEKFDDHRIRLKRPTSARQLDGKLDYDPYRTSIGMSEGSLAAWIVAGVFLGVATLFLLLGLILG